MRNLELTAPKPETLSVPSNSVGGKTIGLRSGVAPSCNQTKPPLSLPAFSPYRTGNCNA